jgi:hypothetical protein
MKTMLKAEGKFQSEQNSVSHAIMEQKLKKRNKQLLFQQEIRIYRAF